MSSTIMSLSLSEKEAQFIRKAARTRRTTLSHIMREAIQRYERQQQWDRIRERGRRTALELGITSYDDVERLIARHG